MENLRATVSIKLLLLAAIAMAASGLGWSAELASSSPAQTDSRNSKTAIEAFARAIQKRMIPRTSALVTEGDKNVEAVFPIVIDPDGNVQSISVKTSSGDPKFDSACMEVIKKAGLPKPPDGAPLKFNLVVRPEHSTRDPDYKYFRPN
ncbi:TonB family protein [Caballeronia sp. INSB1]|uniref:TonB family protein n=1 Tax=Caballeronia sp. INSB1 TaxID=2921751 RepID=UPI00203288D1|nr:TonB family protein [Caballeronia sp. INSB1]